MPKVIIIAVFICLCCLLAGCGETVSGVGKDVNRMGQGLSTFFFRQQ